MSKRPKSMSSDSDTIIEREHAALKRREKMTSSSSLVTRNHLLEMENQRLSTSVRHFEDQMREVPRLVAKLKRVRSEKKELEQRMRDVELRDRDRLHEAEKHDLEFRTQSVLQVKQHRAKIDEMERERKQAAGDIDELRRQLADAQRNHKSDATRAENQERSLLSSARAFFGVDFVSVEALRVFFNGNQICVNAPNDRSPEIDALNNKIKKLKKKLDSERKDGEYQRKLQKERFDVLMESAQQRFSDRVRSLTSKVDENERKLQSAESTNRRRRLFRFTCPSTTIDGAPVRHRCHECHECLEARMNVSEIVRENRRLRDELDVQCDGLLKLESMNKKTASEKRYAVERSDALMDEIRDLRRVVAGDSADTIRVAHEKIWRHKKTIIQLESELDGLCKLCGKKRQTRCHSCVVSDYDYPEWSLPNEIDGDVRDQLMRIFHDGTLSPESKCRYAIGRVVSLWKEAKESLCIESTSRKSVEKFLEEICEIVVGYKTASAVLLRDEGLKDVIRMAAGKRMGQQVGDLRRKLEDEQRVSQDKSVRIDEQKLEINSLNSRIARLKHRVSGLRSVVRSARPPPDESNSLSEYEDLVVELKDRCNEHRRAIRTIAERR